MQSEGNANHFVSIGLNFGITVLCIYPTWVILSELEGNAESNATHDRDAATKLAADEKFDEKA